MLACKTPGSFPVKELSTGTESFRDGSSGIHPKNPCFVGWPVDLGIPTQWDPQHPWMRDWLKSNPEFVSKNPNVIFRDEVVDEVTTPATLPNEGA